jgi:hypothetical protein
MNTIRATFFLVALSLSGGCASIVQEGSGLDCPGATVRQITIVYQKHSKITVAPPRKVVEPGDAINYKVKGPGAPVFKAKGTSGPASYGWLDVTGSGGPNGQSNIVCVPAGQQDGDYEYLIEIEGVGTLDPVVHVN